MGGGEGEGSGWSIVGSWQFLVVRLERRKAKTQVPETGTWGGASV